MRSPSEDDGGRSAAQAQVITPALLPAGQRSLEEQRTQSETMAIIATRLAKLDGYPEPPAEDPVEFEARIERLVADHVEPARSTAYNELGDGRRAVAVATRWLRPKFTAGALVGTGSIGDTAPTR